MAKYFKEIPKKRSKELQLQNGGIFLDPADQLSEEELSEDYIPDNGPEESEVIPDGK